jgi:hypothetical protein
VIDIVKDLVAFIRADDELSAALGTRIYGYRIPDSDDAVPPLCLVGAPSSVPSTRPQTTWWAYLATVDFHTDNPADSLALSSRLEQLAPSFVGFHSSSVVADSQVDSVQPVIDDDWTPTRFRQVVTVALTAREP